MAGVPADQVDAVKNVLGSDSNLSFQFRQVTIESPSALEAKARYFRTRDHLDSPELKGRKRRRRRVSVWTSTSCGCPRRRSPTNRAPPGGRRDIRLLLQHQHALSPAA